MTKEIFLDSLKRALYGKIDDSVLAEHIRYYENYISQEAASGRTEQDILEELGDPRLIAKTILDTSDRKYSYRECEVSEENGGENENRVKVHQFEGWKATLAMIAVVLLILLILVFVFKLVVALLPLLIVLGVIVWIAKKIWN